MRVQPAGREIRNLAAFKEQVHDVSHLAVYMPSMDIYHHYLVISVGEDSMLVIHYSGEKNTLISFGGFAQIKEENIEFVTESEHPKLLDFKSGLILIQKVGYPVTADEQIQAIKRARSRFNENEFKLSYNNCEWFVTWSLTGVGSCDQIEKANANERALADAIDSTLCERESLVKIILSKGSPWAVPIDAVHSYMKIRTLKDQKQAGQIDDHTYKREVTKKVAGTATAGAGAMTGAFIGQILIPIPYVGSAVGFMVGSNVGRLCGSVFSGKLFDIL